MNRTMLLSILAAGLTGALLAEPAADVKTMTPEQRKAYGLQMREKNTGGFIRKRDALPGKVYVFNAQKSIPEKTFDESIKGVFKLMKCPYEVREIGDKVGVSTAGDILASQKAEVGVFIVDEAENKVPMLVAPESRWAIVNVAALKTDNPKPAFFEARANKELVRAILYVCGGANSQYPDSLMRAIVKPADLDKIPSANPPLDVVSRSFAYLPQFGISPNAYTTYRKACQEGWAPAPTNEYQKAIWDKIHAPPEKPLTIPYDKTAHKPVVK